MESSIMNIGIPEADLERLERMNSLAAETVVGCDYPTVKLRIAVVEETGQEILQQRWATPLIGNRARYHWRAVERVTVKQGKEHE